MRQRFRTLKTHHALLQMIVEGESKAEEELRQKLKVAEGDAIGWHLPSATRKRRRLRKQSSQKVSLSKPIDHPPKAETEFGELFDKFGSPAPKKKQKVLKDGPNDSAEKEEREDATSASIGATASGAQEQKTRCVRKEAPKRRREKIKKN